MPHPVMGLPMVQPQIMQQPIMQPPLSGVPATHSMMTMPLSLQRAAMEQTMVYTVRTVVGCSPCCRRDASPDAYKRRLPDPARFQMLDCRQRQDKWARAGCVRAYPLFAGCITYQPDA
jgi:hypothetical protein